MPKYQNLSKNLRENILAILAGSHTNDQLNRLIAVSHTLAYSFLASKTTTGTLVSVYGLNASDLAYDCIAEIFQKDVEGNYIQLYSYFRGLSLTSTREEEILAHLRRLVFSKVNQGIFRLYSEADPTLAKILRNIKIAINSLKNFTEVERFGEPCIVPGLCETMEECPEADREWLQLQFVTHATGREHIPEMLAKLSLFLREQSERCRIVPLVMVGILFRSIYESKRGYTDQSTMIDAEFVENDTARILKDVCASVQKKNTAKYVNGGKIDAGMFDNYFQVLEDALREKFIGGDGADVSLYESLKEYSPGMTKEEYQKEHRNKIEYLLKQLNKEAVKRLKAN